MDTHALYYFPESGVVSVLKPKGGNCSGHWESVLLCLRVEKRRLRAIELSWSDWSRGKEMGTHWWEDWKRERQHFALGGASLPSRRRGAHVYPVLTHGTAVEDTAPVWAFVAVWVIKMQINDHNFWPLNGTSSWKASKSFTIYCSAQKAVFSNNAVRYKGPQNWHKKKTF